MEEVGGKENPFFECRILLRQGGILLLEFLSDAFAEHERRLELLHTPFEALLARRGPARCSTPARTRTPRRIFFVRWTTRLHHLQTCTCTKSTTLLARIYSDSGQTDSMNGPHKPTLDSYLDNYRLACKGIRESEYHNAATLGAYERVKSLDFLLLNRDARLQLVHKPAQLPLTLLHTLTFLSQRLNLRDGRCTGLTRLLTCCYHSSCRRTSNDWLTN